MTCCRLNTLASNPAQLRRTNTIHVTACHPQRAIIAASTSPDGPTRCIPQAQPASSAACWIPCLNSWLNCQGDSRTVRRKMRRGRCKETGDRTTLTNCSGCAEESPSVSDYVAGQHISVWDYARTSSIVRVRIAATPFSDDVAPPNADTNLLGTLRSGS